ncbi:MAG: hypothetical protein PHP98_11750 [Kiritimatiellae bacterium]|nr:hypothetical protein [Kiritimatiellia bacterium]
MDLPLNTSFIDHALDRGLEVEAWDLWKSLHPYMHLGWLKWISFSDYKNLLYSKQYMCTNKSDEEIEEEMGKVIDFYEQKKARRG